MGGWNRSRHVRRHRDRRPPLPPVDYSTVPEHCSVPLWEREFCSYVGDISWQRFCENKQYVGVYNNLEQWDDSGALENFQNAKARFWANYNGQPSDIPLPDPDMYIERIDHRCKVDPKLVAELEKVRVPFDSDYSSAQSAGNKCPQNQSGNWDVYIEKSAEVNLWGDNLGPNSNWGVKHEPSDAWGNNTSRWGDALANPSWHDSSNNHQSSNNASGWGDALVNPSWHGSSNNHNNNSGWGDAVVNPSWHGSRNNHHSSNNNYGWGETPADPSWRGSSNNHHSTGNWSSFHGGSNSNNRCQDGSNMSGRKRNRGGHFQQRDSGQRNQAEDYQGRGWQDRRGRSGEWRPLHNNKNS